MPTIDVLRPDGVDLNDGGWTAVGAASIQAATSDNSDASYAINATPGRLRLTTPAHTPGAGLERHRIRMRIRARSDSADHLCRFGPSRVPGGAPEGQEVWLTTTINDLSGSWTSDPYFILGTSGSVIYVASILPRTSSVDMRLVEAYIDVDTRAKPTFTPQVLDAAGVDQSAGTITVSNLATFVFAAPDYDGLNARSWTLQVHTDPGGVLVFESSGIGVPPDIPAALANGDYIASYQTFSTIRVNDAYASDLETVSFTMDATVPSAPVNLTATPTANPPSIEVCWEAPADISGWAEPTEVYAEITRTDCNGTERIALVPDGLAGCWTDRFMSLSAEGIFCGEEDHECEVCYDIRYWGYTDLVVEPSTDPIPEGVIFAWPDTAASIPTNWTRVAAMDSRYPKGIPTAATNPGTTGGSATHTHTTPGHDHSLNHSHTQPNTTAGSGQVATSPTASLATATHTHTRPTTSSTNVDSNSDAPAASAASTDQSRKEVVFVESDGIDTAVPAGMLAVAHQTTPPSGWVTEGSDGADASSFPPFWKGAATNGSLNFDEVTGHTHSIAAHLHSAGNHIHTSADSGLPSATTLAGEPPPPTGAHDTHRHPLTVVSAPLAGLASGAGGTTAARSSDPSFRYTNFLESVTGEQFVGLVGMWQGTIASIPTGWLLCDGTGGTPNFLDTYPRYKGPFTVNGTGGGAAHTHPTPNHNHTTSGHTHAVTIGAADAVFGATAAGTGAASGEHTHAGSTNSTTPTVGNSSSGATSSDTPEPPYIETAYIMLAQGSDVGLDTSVLVVSNSETVCADPLPNPTPGNAWIRGAVSGDMPVCPEESYGAFRPFGVFQPIGGGRPTVTTGTPGGRDYNLSFVVESEADQVALEAILAQPLVFYQPVAQADIWLAPNITSATVTKVKRLRTLTVDTIAVNPQPVADPETTVPFPPATSP